MRKIKVGVLGGSRGKTMMEYAVKSDECYLAAVREFNGASPYAYLANQVAFGPRVPNTAAHKACGDYLASELKRFGAKVYQQEAILTAYDGTKL